MKLRKASRLNTVIELGSQSHHVDEITGITKSVFSSKLTVYGAPYSLSISQPLSVEGMTITNSKVYLVRHRQDWEALKLKLAKIDGVEYEITGINPDAGHDYMAYDQLILKKEGANG